MNGVLHCAEADLPPPVHHHETGTLMPWTPHAFADPRAARRAAQLAARRERQHAAAVARRRKAKRGGKRWGSGSG